MPAMIETIKNYFREKKELRERIYSVIKENFEGKELSYDELNLYGDCVISTDHNGIQLHYSHNGWSPFSLYCLYKICDFRNPKKVVYLNGYNVPNCSKLHRLVRAIEDKAAHVDSKGEIIEKLKEF